MKHLEDYLRLNAQQHPDKPFVIVGDEVTTYSEFWSAVQSVLNQPDGILPPRGDKRRGLILRASQDARFLVSYFAAHLAGVPVVPLESDTTDERYTDIVSIVDGADIPDDVADILFTTGTTGSQKGTMLSHRAIVSNAENLIDAQGFCAETLFVISGPLNHIGSLSKVWPTVIVGGTLCITDGMKDMEAFFAAMKATLLSPQGGKMACAEQKIATFLVPASIRMLLQFGADRLSEYADRIDFIETGAAPMSQADMERLCQLLPSTRLYNTYASTETGIICTHDYNAEGCIAGCLGRPMKHSTLIITDEGFVACQGPTLMTGYVGDSELTASILRDSTLFTHDKGYVDEHGRLRLLGRDGDVINVGGYKVNPVEVEDAASSLPGIADCICIEGQHPVLGASLRLLVVLSEGSTLTRKDIAQHLLARLERHKVPQMYSFVSSVQRTYNGKLDRKYYRK